MVQKALHEAQLRFGTKFSAVVLICLEPQLKQMKTAVKDAVEGLDDEDQMYDTDMDNDQSFLKFVFNCAQVADEGKQ